MNATLSELFEDVKDATEKAHLVAFDGCHKIYLAMDEIEAKWFEESDYTIKKGSPSEMYRTALAWYDESCGLRFINAVEHNEENPNAGYTALVPQGASDEVEVDDNEDEEF